MKLRFSINYHAEWGQQLTVLLNYEQQDGQLRHMRAPMQTQDGDLWQTETSVVDQRRNSIIRFTYIYI